MLTDFADKCLKEKASGMKSGKLDNCISLQRSQLFSTASEEASAKREKMSFLSVCCVCGRYALSESCNERSITRSRKKQFDES